MLRNSEIRNKTNEPHTFNTVQECSSIKNALRSASASRWE